MATFTWTATGPGSSAWETTASWVGTSPTNPSLASFTTSPGNDYLISSPNLFTINEIGAGGTASPDIANSLTVSNTLAQVNLLLHNDHGAFDVTTNLSIASGLLNLGTVGGSVLSMGGINDGGTISLGASGRLEGSGGDTVQDIGSTPTKLIGTGTIIAQDGVFTIGNSVQVAPANNLKFLINPSATLAFADVVSSGTVIFGGGIGTVLDVAALSTFDAALKGLSVGTARDTAVNYVDFLNVGTTATATLTGFTSTGATLTVFTNGGSHIIPILGSYLGKNANVNYISDGNGGTNVFITNVPCYVAGTAILTPEGEVAVETIQAGDVVTTSDGGRLVPRRVTWTGQREIDLASHPKPEAVAAIRFRRGALGTDLPRRDLLVSPNHCLFIDGGLVPAKLLVNGMTIVRDLSVASVSYHHIELDNHAILLAEGVEAESYLDTGNRAYFRDMGLATMLHPEFGINERARCRESGACAPLLTRPEEVRSLWQRFTDRAVWLGFAEPEQATTRDPALRLMVDGRTIRPLPADGGPLGRNVSFLIPERAASIRLVSRRTVPAELWPWLDDPRPLGVAVRSVTMRDRGGETVAGADHPALTDGWYDAEYSENGVPWRWTTGDAALPIVSDGSCLVEISLGAGFTYVAEGVQRAA